MLKCTLCCSTKDDDVTYGSFHKKGEVAVHQNCLYLTTNMVQHGDDDNGILRFLEKDIIAEARSLRHKLCKYCNNRGANIRCCYRDCYANFHTGCGIEKGAQCQFFGNYKSFCRRHVHTHKYRPAATEDCAICLDKLSDWGEFSVTTMIFSPCCHNGWYHKSCLQKYANTAGYFFKCPLCNNSSEFRDVTRWGISIPNTDAAWELEPGAFRDQTERELACTASTCNNRQGRAASQQDLCYCQTCGSNPVHLGCTSFADASYMCETCIIVSLDDDGDSDDSDENETDPFEIFGTMLLNRSNFQMAQQNLDESLMTREHVRRKLCAASSDSGHSNESDSDFDLAFDSKENKPKQSRDNKEDKAEAASQRYERTQRQIESPLPAARLRRERSRSRSRLAENRGQEESSPAARSGTAASQQEMEVLATPPPRRRSLRSSSRSAKPATPIPKLGIAQMAMPLRSRQRHRAEASPATPKLGIAQMPMRLSSRQRHTTQAANPRTGSANRRGSLHPPTGPAQPQECHSPFDISCVANRTRRRLPVYLDVRNSPVNKRK